MNNFMGDNIGNGINTGAAGFAGPAALAWLMFENSGEIGHYNLYSKLREEDERLR